MKASQADPEEAQGSWSLNVRCGAATGTIHLKDDGMFSFTPDPANARPHRSPIGWLFRLLRRPVQHQVIPADQLLGARLESPCTLTVWFATPHTARMGCVTKHLFRVRQTPRFEASDPLAASELVARVRRAASWWGRDTPPHVAAIINPKAGRGGAAGLFHGRLLPLLRDVAGLRVSERLTEAAGHASALVRELALNVAGGGVGGGGDGGDEGGVGGGAGDVPAADGVDLIMFVGGDGTLHEGLQGLFQRPDWESARGIPLVAIPCGSGNGVAASCGLWDVPTAVVAVCRGQVAPVDVASVLQPPDNRYYCLLSVVYGAMANLDIGTEHWRWMGELRFHLGGLREIFRGRCYHCRAFVLPPDAPAAVTAPSADAATTAAAAAAAAAGAAGSPACGNCPVDYGRAPTPSGAELEQRAVAMATVAAGEGSVGAVMESARRCGDVGIQEPLLPQAAGSACVGMGGAGASTGPAAAAAATGRRCDSTDDRQVTLLAHYPSGPALPLLSQLPCLPTRLPDSPSSLPGGWQQLADSFAIFGAYNTQYVALGARANPGGLMADGAWEVWQLAAQGRRAGAGLRLRSLKVLLGVEDGSFAKAAGVMHVTKARALLFQQRDDSTWTVLDGEAVREAPLYLEVHPRLCRLLVSPVFREEPL